MNEISNGDLNPDQIPQPEAGWYEIGSFALTFNGYEFHGSLDACGEIANHWLKTYETDGALPETLTDLRTCLFFEQRRWRHYGYDPDEETMLYIRALVAAILKKVKNRANDSSK